MSSRKILFLDVDGTITDYEGNIPASCVAAIRAARANGHLAYMCTGRSKAEVPPELEAIGFDGMIGGNGSYVESAGEVVMHQLITAEQCISAPILCAYTDTFSSSFPFCSFFISSIFISSSR